MKKIREGDEKKEIDVKEEEDQKGERRAKEGSGGETSKEGGRRINA